MNMEPCLGMIGALKHNMTSWNAKIIIHSRQADRGLSKSSTPEKAFKTIAGSLYLMQTVLAITALQVHGLISELKADLWQRKEEYFAVN